MHDNLIPLREQTAMIEGDLIELTNTLPTELAKMPYPEFVSALCKDGEEIKRQLTPEQAHILHMGVGAAGEGGELLDAIKRWTIYQKPIDLLNVIEELGDLKFFTTEIMTRLGITDDMLEMHNKGKLSKRYSQLRYTDADAATRADKA